MRDIFVDPALQARFEADGYVQVDLLTPADIDRLIELHDSKSSALASASPWSFTAMSDDAAYRRAMSDGIRAVLQPRLDRFLDRCRAVLGTFFHKLPASDASRIAMHQDWSWVDERRHHSLSVWMPFQAVSESNGTLAVVPRSHRLSDRPRGFVTQFPYPDLEQVLATRYSRHLTLELGEAVLFHQRLFHWSSPNRSEQRRLAANCFVAPQEAAIVYPHPDASQPGRLELFEADDALLASFVLGTRPDGARSLGWIETGIEPLDLQQVERILGAA
jgi:hypothetical protein